MVSLIILFFFFQAEDGIRDGRVTGVQTCALPICGRERGGDGGRARRPADRRGRPGGARGDEGERRGQARPLQIGRASCRGRGEMLGGGGSIKKKKRGEKRRGVHTARENEPRGEVQ